MKHLPVIISFFILVVPAVATTFVNRPVNEIIKETVNIVRGRPGPERVDWDKAHRNIYTYTNFVVTDVLRGDVKETKILLRQPGGAKDGIEMNVPGVAHFDLEEDVVVLISARNEEDGSYDVPGFTTGKYNVVPGENGEPVLVNSLGGSAVYDPNKDPRTLSYNSRIPLEVFKRLAKGEDIPEASHRQYERSGKPAPSGAFEAGHHHESAPVPKVGVAPTAPNSNTSKESFDPKSSSGESNGVWVSLGFAVLAVIGAAILWRVIRASQRREELK